MNPPAAQPYVNVLGTGVHPVNLGTATDAVLSAAEANQRGYVCVTGVHGVIEARRDPGLRRILNRAFLNVPDGMPLVWVGRGRGFSHMGRVYGPEFMLEVCRASVSRSLTHFLYGGKPGVADELKAALETRVPGLRIVGTYGPPFRPLNGSEQTELAARVDACRPDFFWVGLSTPKQERFMAEYLPRLNVRLMAGVGAAFDVHTGRMADAPRWVKGMGLQWLHRLGQEPRRLARRYAVIVPSFLCRIALQSLGLRNYPVER